MPHTNVLKHLRDLFRHGSESVDPDAFSGPTLIDQEPELAHELARPSGGEHSAH